jgi:NIMA (never in mitosis gene a)-related kinase
MNTKTKDSNRNAEKVARTVGGKLADFEVLCELGRGSYGVVFKVKSLIDNNIYVMKRLDLKHMKEKAQKEAWKEAMILKKLNHPNIIRYYISFLEEDNLYIVMEYAEGGDLYSVI